MMWFITVWQMTSLVTLQKYAPCVIIYYSSSASLLTIAGWDDWQTLKGQSALNHCNTYFSYSPVLERYALQIVLAGFIISTTLLWHQPNNKGKWNFIWGAQSFGNIGKTVSREDVAVTQDSPQSSLWTPFFTLKRKRSGTINVVYIGQPQLTFQSLPSGRTHTQLNKTVWQKIMWFLQH